MRRTVPILPEDPYYFPSPSVALTEPNGLLAMGGDLSPQRLLAAYQQGIFPWYDDTTPILWWSPNPRAVLWVDDLIIHKSLGKILKKHDFTYLADTKFERVISACAAREKPGLKTGVPSTWITDDLKQSFCTLHRMGYAHSIEIYQQSTLVGGLYGLSLGSTFFGESMFHTAPNFSKVALVVLVMQLKHWGFRWIDCQVWSEHLGSMGAKQISRDDFLKQLKIGVGQPSKIGPWQLDHDLLA